MPSKRINSVDNIQCGFVIKIPLEDAIEYIEKSLIPMIEEYGEAEMNISLTEAKKELKEMKEELENEKIN